MDTTPVMAKPQINPPLLIAGGVLAGMAVLQLVALAVFFASNARKAVTQARATATAELAPKVTVSRSARAIPAGAIVASRIPANAEPLTPEVSLPQSNPTPVPPARIRSANKALVSELVDMAINNREKGDMMAALTKLKEAQTMAPEPQIIAELALTYERMGWNEKAIEHWARVKDFGESAGLFYDMADQKLKNGVGPHIPRAQMVRPAATPQTRGLFGFEEESAMPGIPPEDGTTARLVELADVTSFDEPPGDALKRLRLRATVQAKPGTIERQNVQIQVVFYDILDGEHVVQTAAEVIHQWITHPPDWSDDGVEVLEVDYKLSKSEGEKAEDRKYYGYEVRLYYDNELQAVRAEPTRLLNLFPAPPMLTSETETEPKSE